MEKILMKTKVVGVDIGVEQTTYALVDIRGNILAKETFRTTDYPDVNDYVTKLSECIVMMGEANGGYETVRSVGVSAPSANFMTGCIEHAGNLSWKGVVPLAAMLRDRLGLAVAVANDAHITALGEKDYGSAHGMKDFVVISLGHGGIGSCIFTNGEPHLGANGFAGEVGHVCVVEEGRQCSCGRKGYLEEYSSARGLLKTAEELMAASSEPSLLRGQQLTLERIVDCCEQGDAMAIEVFRRAGAMLGQVLANYASILNPEAIILTGELIKCGHWLVDPMCEAIDESVFPNIKGKLKLYVSILDNSDRDVLGASALAWDVKEYSLFK